MKILYFFVLFISSQIYSQVNSKVKTELNETDSIYLKSIEKYLEQNVAYYKIHFPKEIIYKTIYIQSEKFLEKLPAKLNGYQIIQVENKDLHKYFKNNKSQITLVQISSISIENSLFYITISPYSVEKKSKNKMKFILSDWTNVYFRFEGGKLVFNKIETEGI
ncbi:hypothetical protein [Flavobacterium noncentrifugens]|uniref:Uncharacterized protein n=1 Tax=Flavobacterium noncentrifugens TaxID=1128970 RepID=A0A1G9C1W6_9FLAO|nr:hypothetical protein [Flavobacterium noncentrifugens]SDK45454.1 hypothetical protein SAMN04487935_3435 [Flavobacterium noncentrifugens]